MKKYFIKEKKLKKRQKMSDKIIEKIEYLLLILVVLIILIPVWFILVKSFDIAPWGLEFSIWPLRFSFNNYKYLYILDRIRQSIHVSLLATIVGSVLGTFVTIMGAWVLAQKEMPGRSFMAVILLIPVFFYRDMISFYLVMKKIELVNTIWCIILPSSINVLLIFWLKEYFEGVPLEITEAAKIDGCNVISLFFKIVLPISKPAIVTVLLNYVVMYWNDYTSWKVLITKSSLYNNQMVIRQYLYDALYPVACGPSEYTEAGLVSAFIIVTLLPLIIIFVIFQENFMNNVSVGIEKE